MLTAEKIEARQYAMAQAIYHEPFKTRRFLVEPTCKAEAYEAALAHARRTWGEPAALYVYPRNYVSKARELFALGEVA